MSKRLNKEQTLNIFQDNFNFKIGLVDKNVNNTIYINGNSWIEPKSSVEDFTSEINSLKRAFNVFFVRNLKYTNFNHDKYIVVLDIKNSGISFNKRSFINFELHLKHKDTNFNFKENLYKEEIIQLINRLINECFFNFSFLYYNNKNSTN